jgi:thioredoxin reductase
MILDAARVQRDACDVAVIGGGPAGSTAATLLALRTGEMVAEAIAEGLSRGDVSASCSTCIFAFEP